MSKAPPKGKAQAPAKEEPKGKAPAKGQQK